MQLTFDEVRQAFLEATRQEPEDLERMLAEYMPQGTRDKLVHELSDYWMSHGLTIEEAAERIAAWMMGFHHAWVLASKAMHDGT